MSDFLTEPYGFLGLRQCRVVCRNPVELGLSGTQLLDICRISVSYVIEHRLGRVLDTVLHLQDGLPKGLLDLNHISDIPAYSA